MTETFRLLGDMGATHARLALVAPDGAIAEEKIFETADYDRLEDVLGAYLGGLAAKPTEAALGIAAPITGDIVQMVNCPWRFSLGALKQQFGWRRIYAVNDFAANALCVPYLEAGDLVKIGEGEAAPGAAIAVVGPGTGLGVGGLVPHRGQWAVIPGEGGNVTLAAMDGREAALIDIVRRQYAHVSAEQFLSGPGLVNLYDSLCELAGKPAGPLTPEHVTNLYPGCDPQCREAVVIFCAMLGTFAGDVALTLGARGGVYIMGGIVPKMLEVFRHSQFRERFEFKGRYRRYLEAIPTYVVIHECPAFLGLRTLFED